MNGRQVINNGVISLHHTRPNISIMRAEMIERMQQSTVYIPCVFYDPAPSSVRCRLPRLKVKDRIESGTAVGLAASRVSLSD